MSLIESTLKTSLWHQFVAAIDMLESSLTACPDDLWHYRSQQQEFWYMAYHCLFWLDLYLSGAVEGFTPPAPFRPEGVGSRRVAPRPPANQG